MPPKIAITMGDPAGIGPEVAVLVQHARRELFSWCRPVVYGDPAILRRAVRVTSVPRHRRRGRGGPGGSPSRRDLLNPGGGPLRAPLPAWLRGDGRVYPVRGGRRSLRQGRGDRHPPDHEGRVEGGGRSVPRPHRSSPLTGGGADVVMMLAGDRLRVALVTIHVGLRRALELLSPALIEKTVRITDAFFRRYMGTPPRGSPWLR